MSRTYRLKILIKMTLYTKMWYNHINCLHIHSLARGSGCGLLTMLHVLSYMYHYNLKHLYAIIGSITNKHKPIFVCGYTIRIPQFTSASSQLPKGVDKLS